MRECVDVFIIAALADIENSMPIVVGGHSADAGAVERRTIAMQCAVDLRISVVASTAIW